MRTLVLTLVAAASVLVIAPVADAHGRLLAPRGKCGGAERKIWKSDGAQQRAMRCLVRHARRRAGRARLRSSWQLNRAAERKANRIASCGFSHTACGRSFLSTYRRTGYGRGSWSVGEVIGWGSRRRGSARSIVHRWLHSSSHRSTILGRRWRHVGVGRRYERRHWGHRRVTIWVVSFGRP